MATIKIEVVAGANTFTHLRTVSAAHLVRLLAAYRGILGQVPDEEGEPGDMRDMTDEETAEAWAVGLFNGTKANVLNFERGAAGQSAAAAVAEITLTE